MIEELIFTVYGVAQPKGSARAFMPKGARFPVVTSDNPKNKNWQQLVAEGASHALARVGAQGALFTGPVRLNVVFYLPRPQSLQKRVTHHCKNPDLDKLLRSVGDALTKVVWQDDAQVVMVTGAKHYADLGASPRATIQVRLVA